MFGIGPPELLVIFLIILILFGAKRLPELARSLGRSINEFKNATQDIKSEFEMNSEDALPRQKTNPAAPKSAPPKSEADSEKENLAG